MACGVNAAGAPVVGVAASGVLAVGNGKVGKGCAAGIAMINPIRLFNTF